MGADSAVALPTPRPPAPPLVLIARSRFIFGGYGVNKSLTVFTDAVTDTVFADSAFNDAGFYRCGVYRFLFGVCVNKNLPIYRRFLMRGFTDAVFTDGGFTDSVFNDAGSPMRGLPIPVRGAGVVNEYLPASRWLLMRGFADAVSTDALFTDAGYR